MNVVQSNPKKDDDIENQNGKAEEAEYLPYSYEINEGAYRSEMTASVPAPCCYKRKIGRMYVCCEDQDQKPTCLFGACWPMTFITWALVAFPVIGVSILVIPAMNNPVAEVVSFIFTTVIVLIYSITLFCTGFSNPGIFKRHKDPVDGWTFHTSTNSYRPRGVVFCSESQVLVEEIDHFCPWTGTTIAKGNLKCFSIFVTMVCVGILYLPALLVISMMVGGVPGS